MTVARRPWRTATFALLAILAACSSPPPKLYTIAPMDGSTRTGGPSIILLQQIGLARYLERSQIVRSSENYQLDVMLNDWWGEPLASMLSRVLIDELNQRLPGSAVLNETGALSPSADATIALNIGRLDQDATGKLVLQAQAAVTFKGKPVPAPRSFRFVVAPGASDVRSEVAAVSVAVGQLADGLASMLVAGHAAR